MRIKVTIKRLEDLQELRQLIDEILSDQPGKPAPKKAATKKAEPAPEPVKDPEPEAKEPARTAEEIINAAEAKDEADETAVKVMLADKIKGGKKAEVKALFEEYGITKLSELTAKYPDKLVEFSKKAEAL